MEVIQKGARIWRKDIETQNGSFPKYSMSVSKKTDDGEYLRTYFRVVFSKKSGIDDIENGATVDINRAFMTVDGYKKDGKMVTEPVIVVMEAELATGENFSQIVDDLPF